MRQQISRQLKSSILSKLFADSAIYGGGDFIAKLVALITFPLIATALSSAGFGLLELAMTIVALGGVLVRCGLNNAVQRFYWDSTTTSMQRPVLVSTGLWLMFVLGVAISLLGLITAPFLFDMLGTTRSLYSTSSLLAIGLLLAFTPLNQYLLDILRLHFAPWKFLGFSFLSRALASVLAVIAALYLHAGVEGVLKAQAFVLALVLPLGMWLIRRDLILQFDIYWSKKLAAFGIPLIFTEIAYWLFSSIDRWMLASMGNIESVGVYSVAFRFSSVVMFVATAFGMAWSPYAFKLRTDYPETHRKMYSEVLIILLIVMLCVAGAVSLFAGELIHVFLPTEYNSAVTPLIVLCFTVVIQASQQITAVGISIANKTMIFAYLVWIAAGCNAALNFWLIPEYGATGAAWATLIVYLFLSASFLFFTQRYYKLPIAWLRIAWINVLGAIVLLVSLEYQQQDFSFSVSAGKLIFAILCLLLASPAINLSVFKTENQTSLKKE